MALADAPITSKYGVMLAEAETSYGTDPTPLAAGNSVLIYDVSISAPNAPGDPDYFKPTADTLHVVRGSVMADVSFKAALCGAGLSTGNVVYPPLYDVLKASKLAVTATAGGAEFTRSSTVASVTIAPDTIRRVGCTLWIYFLASDSSANRYIVNGWQGSAKLLLDPSSQPFGVWEFSGQGIYTTPAESAPPTPIYYETTPPRIIGRTATYNAVAYNLRKFELDMGTTIAQVKTMGPVNSFGYGHFLGARGKVKAKLTVDALKEAVAANKFDAYTQRDSAAALALSVSPIGSTADGNTFALSVPRTHILNIAEGDDNGIKTYEFDLACSETAAGDDSFSVVHT